MLFLQMSDVRFQPSFINGAELLHQHQRRQLQAVLCFEKVMSGQLGLGVHFAGYGCHNDRGAVLVSSIVLNNKDRAIPFLFGADSPAQIGIVHIAAQICLIHVYDLPLKCRRQVPPM